MTTKHQHLEPAFVLHRYPYRESSFLVDLFTENHGRLSVVARGAHRAKSPMPGLLQPFIPLLVSWRGKGELMTLMQVEANDCAMPLQGDCLFAGLYLNELLMYLLQKWDPHAELYTCYANTLALLRTPPLAEKTLRAFEKHLLEALGYGLLSKQDQTVSERFLPDQYYYFIPDRGFVVHESHDTRETASHLFSGESLLAIANENWDDEACLMAAKRLTRCVLAPLLGARPIYSRQLFMMYGER